MNALRVPSRPGTFLTSTTLPSLHCVTKVTLLAIISQVISGNQVSATPIDADSVIRRATNDDDDPGDGPGGTGTNPKIYVPIVVACVILFILVILSSKSNIRRTFSNLSFSNFALTGAAPTSGLANGAGAAAAGRRELTAEQLAGTINGDGTTPARTGPQTTRRPRRPRRTPSQMSVTSLPAYNKEPGEEELVVFRGRDMEDATMPPASVVRQSNDSSASLSIDHSQVSRYSPMPTAQNHVPLLNPDDTYEGDLSMQSLPSPIEHRHEDEDGNEVEMSNRRRISMRTRRNSDAGSHETSSLMRVETNDSGTPPDQDPDPRGEAPPYFEVVDYEDLSPSPEPTSQAQNQFPPSAQLQPPTQTPAQNTQGTTGRRGFRSLFNRMSIASPSASAASQPNGNNTNINNTTHNRNHSSTSAFSNPGRETTSRASNHRSQHSGSGSVLSASMFRTISRQRSIRTLASHHAPSASRTNINNLTSPSMISLNSISSPLPHTLTRTEFTYPSKGLTAEQLKVISSREGLARFGVPYGDAAIRYASESRVDLGLGGGVEPPAFEEVVDGVAGGSGASGSGSGSTNMDVATASSSSPPIPPLPTTTTTNASATNQTNDNSPSTSPSSSPQTSTQTPSSPLNSSLNSATHNSISKSLSPPSTSDTPTTSSRISSSSIAISTSEFGLLTTPMPPHDRSQTQTSVRSVQSYATAAETLDVNASTRSRSRRHAAGSEAASEEDDDDDDEEVFEDAVGGEGTPRIGGHELLASDATVVPSSVNAAARS